MPEDAHVRPNTVQPGFGFSGHLAFFIQHMTQRDAHPAASKEAPAREAARFIPVDITRNCRNRRNATQTSNDRLVTDVAGMQDFRNPGKMPLDCRVIEPMSVGDDADPKRPPPGQRAEAPLDG